MRVVKLSASRPSEFRKKVLSRTFDALLRVGRRTHDESSDIVEVLTPRHCMSGAARFRGSACRRA